MAPKRWKMKNGVEVLIEQMSTEHIVNALELIRRKAIDLNQELRARGVEQMFDEVKNRHLKELTRDMDNL